MGSNCHAGAFKATPSPARRWSLLVSRSAMCDSELASQCLGPLIAGSFLKACLAVAKDTQARPL